MSALNERLLAAYAAGDKRALVRCYEEASRRAPTEDARSFFLTQAYVYALEIDHPDTAALLHQLRDLGREE